MAFDASDWIGTQRFQQIPGAEANGSAVSTDIQALVAGRPWGDDFEYDPEADTIAIFSHRREHLQLLIQELQRARLIEDVELGVYSTEQDESELPEEPAASSSLADLAPTEPGRLAGPYEWPDTGELRAYLHNDTRWEWRTMSGDELAIVVANALDSADLGHALVVSVDGRESICIDGSSVDDFRRAADALGLAGIDEEDE